MFAWQGWKISLPDGWNPVKLEGDYARGQALIADVNGPRLGMRWATVGRIDPKRWVRKTLVEEVGKVAAAESRESSIEGWEAARIYSDPTRAARDIFLARSVTSRRMIELVCHVNETSLVRIDDLVRSFEDCPPDDQMPWAVFGLSCHTPAGWRLTGQQLHAGDLSLSFRRGRDHLTLRQIALAQLALKRLPLERWLAQQQQSHSRTHRAAGALTPASFVVAGQRLEGLMGQLQRRRRFFWATNLPKQITTLALHDPQHDRLLLAQASQQALAEQLVRSIGASTTESRIATTADSSARKPMRSSQTTLERRADGTARVQVPLKGGWFIRPGATRTFELDEIGLLVWDSCDGHNSLQQITRAVADRYRLNLREAEVATMKFLETLARKGLIGMRATHT